MEATHVCKGKNGVQQSRRGELYTAPAIKRLTPDEAKQLLLQRADMSDPEVRHMLDCIEQLKGTRRV